MNEICVFLDRDGTINEEIGYLSDFRQFKFIPRSIEAIKMINRIGLKAIVVTNQAGIARGYIKEKDLLEIHRFMEDRILHEGGFLDAIYFCPHHPDGDVEEYRRICNCRKPRAGMLYTALKRFKIRIEDSYIIGDRLLDISMAYNAGAKGILVRTGNGQEEINKNMFLEIIKPHFIANDLYEGVTWIINDLKAKNR